MDGQKQRSFTYPLKGRMEPDARQRSLREQKITQMAWKAAVPESAGKALAVAREMVKWDWNRRATVATHKHLPQGHLEAAIAGRRRYEDLLIG